MAIKLTYGLPVAGLLLPLSAFALGLGDISSQSRLDQQLDARIPITASAQEMDSLEVRLAPDEAFDRANLDKPPVLNHLHFDLVNADGQAYIHVTSDKAIHEPFLRFLVQASWPQGQVIREYTVLLDPPVLLEGAAKQAPNPVQVINPPASTASPEPTKRPLRRQFEPHQKSEVADAHYGPIQAGETLSQIAQRLRNDEPVTINQMMTALYRDNPAAFKGNINRLLAGAVLSVPPVTELNTISSSEAKRFVAEQMDAWRNTRQARFAAKSLQPGGTQAQVNTAPADRPHLELVAPDEAVNQPTAHDQQPYKSTTAADGTGTASPQAQQRVQQLETELAQTKQLLAVKNEELAALQAQLAKQEGKAGAGPGNDRSASEQQEKNGQPTAPPEPPVGESTMLNKPDSAPDATRKLAPPQAAAPAPHISEAGQPAAPEPGDRSWWGWLRDVVLNPLFLGFVGAAGVLLVLFRRKRSTNDEQESDTEVSPLDDFPTQEFSAPLYPHETILASRPVDAAPVEEEVVPVTKPIAEDLGVDRADPLAEIGFYLAHGLYDEALGVVDRALQAEPLRRDLKLKRLEILFASGDNDAFLKHAYAMAAEPEGKADSYWERAAQMGRQLLPEESLFKSDAPSLPPEHIDLDIQFPVSAPQADADVADFEVNELEPVERFTQPFTTQDDAGQDLSVEDVYEEASLILPEDSAAPTRESANPDLASAQEIAEHATIASTWSSDEAEVTPIEEIDLSSDHLLQFDVQDDVYPTLPAEEEISLSAEDFTLDLSAEIAADLDQLDEQAPGLNADTDSDATYLATNDFHVHGALDEDIETKLDLAKAYIAMEEFRDASSLLQAVLQHGNAAQQLEANTLLAQLPERNQEKSSDVALDDVLMLDETDSSVEEYVLDTEDSMQVEDADLNDVETKLDLARAYLDMKDADGARSLLEEVLKEGDEKQRQLAQIMLAELKSASQSSRG